MKPVKLLKPNMKPMKRTPKRSYASGSGLFWVIVALVVIYFLFLMTSHYTGGNALLNIFQGEEPPTPY